MVKEVSPDELQRLLVSENAMVVDVRETEEYLAGGIANAMQWPLSTFALHEKDVPQDRPTVFYCRSGLRSLKAAEIAEKWTSNVVYSLRGGFLKYVEHVAHHTPLAGGLGTGDIAG